MQMFKPAASSDCPEAHFHRLRPGDDSVADWLQSHPRVRHAAGLLGPICDPA
jgi:hypothetical protein